MAPIVWGTFAFGAVYPWAFIPLAGACGVAGVFLLVLERDGRPPLTALAVGLAAIGLAVTLQLVPLPAETLTRVSPRTAPLVAQYEQAYGVLGLSPNTAQSTRDGQPAPRPISIAPDRTRIGLLLFGTLAVFFLGVSRLLSATGSIAISRFLIGTGLVLALVGIGQYALTLHEPYPLVYGFWKPKFITRPFGPFINPNHFAGWMLMVLPLALALFYEALLQTLREARMLTRNRIAIASTPSFGTLVVLGLSALVMGLALLMTRSRSGLAAFAAGSALAAWTVFRRQKTTMGRLAVVGSFVVLLGGAGIWAGVDTLASKFVERGSGRDFSSVGGRIAIWKDTLHIFRAFPLTGSGLNTYGTAMSLYQTFDRTSHYQEAHNDYLQVLAEGGALVGVPVLFTLGLFIREVRRRFREAPKEGTTYWLRVGAVVGMISIGLQSLVEFSLQMPANAALFAALAAIALHQSPSLRRSVESERTDAPALKASKLTHISAGRSTGP